MQSSINASTLQNATSEVTLKLSNFLPSTTATIASEESERVKLYGITDRIGRLVLKGGASLDLFGADMGKLESELPNLLKRSDEIVIDCGSTLLNDDSLLGILRNTASSFKITTLETDGFSLTPRIYFRLGMRGKIGKVVVRLPNVSPDPVDLNNKIRNNLNFYAYLIESEEIGRLIITIPYNKQQVPGWQEYAGQLGASLATPISAQASDNSSKDDVAMETTIDTNQGVLQAKEVSDSSEQAGRTHSYTDCWNGLELREYQKYLIELVDRQISFRDKTVLELGSDVNLNTAQAMIRLGAKAVYAVNPALAVDIEPPVPGIIPVTALCEKAGFPDNFFDLVFGIALLEHVNNLEDFAKECLRMCKMGGACFLQGNPLWTWKTGHHTYIASSPKSGLPYFYSDSTTPYEPWEHLTISSDAEASERLRTKGIDERDIPLLIDHLLREPFISRRTPTEIEKTFQKIVGDSCVVTKGLRRVEPNDHFRHALAKYSEDDLRCEDIRISFIKSDNATQQPGIPIAFLGHTAFPAHLFSMLGLMKDVKGGEGPFDYAFVPVHKIVNNLVNTFSDLGKNLHYDVQKGYWIDSSYGALFNHDSDCGEQDIEILRSRIDKRVRKFKEIALDSGTPVFVFSAYFLNDPVQKIVQLVKVLRSLRQGRKFMLLTLGAPELLRLKLPGEAVVVVAKFPVASLSEWWQPQNRETDAAKDFCRKIKRQLSLVISEYHAIAG